LQHGQAERATRLLTNKEQNADLFYQAANYYYTTGRDLKQAAGWAAEAEKADKENFNYPNLLQKILADLKDYKAAIAAAKRALVLAEKENMTSTVTGLKKRIAEWEK
jgi:tetratricopeptide (TPR) repeat protein